jgi:Fe-Mn family superoxide dismutase
MTFTLPQLPFGTKALEPYITEQTLNFHYGKHHQTYVNNLNNLIKGTKFENYTSLTEIIMESTGGIFNNAAQVWNHSFYWESIAPNAGGEPVGKISELINSNFGSFAEFKEKYTIACNTLFGSGWVWLVLKNNNQLEIIQESNAGNPLRNGLKPILTCDVWEHSYYLDYQNRRPDYVNAFWNIINWNAVNDRIK